MIRFQKMTLEDRPLVEGQLWQAGERGCEYSFANLYLWGRQRFAFVDGFLVLFSQFDRRSVYPFPVGQGNVKPVLDKLIHDAAVRDIPCRITGMSREECELLETLYPGRFRIHCDRSGFDYVYDIHDLAELKGRKYQKKRNHLNRYHQSHPQSTAQPLSEENLEAVRQMALQWYEDRQREMPEADFHMERTALLKALEQHRALGMEGLVLREGERVIAFTLGSFLKADTVDVHFEKAVSDVDGAYAAVNCAFARYLREKYPRLLYLNREDDMGLEGLRKAKLSYCPHHLVEKYWACLLEDGYEY
ncbi:MAG: DUF2156 domain-containing protein [Oscillospiraceae bacterium]|nr:DUF2156 domain-containing protein [Oscillospiraceae bacterium]